MDCSPPGSSIHGISQARILEWVSMSFSKGSSWPRHRTRISCVGRQILNQWAPGEAHWPLCPLIKEQSQVCVVAVFVLVMTCLLRILVPQAGNEPRLQQWKQQIITPGPPGNCPPTLRSLSDIPAFPGEISEGTQFLRCHPQSTSIYFRLCQTACVSRNPSPHGNTWESSAYSEPGSDTVEGTGGEKTQAKVLGTQAFTALRLVPRGPGLRIPIRFQQTELGKV